MVTEVLISAKEIVKIFANATLNNDIETIADLLSNNGEFQTQDIALDDVASKKEDFLKWYKVKLQANKVESISYDNCLHCSLGNPVVLFNNGLFPRSIKDSSERSKAGLMLKVENGLVAEIKFCHVFAVTDNDYVYECHLKKAKEFMAQGFTHVQAIEKAIKIDLKDLI